MPQQWRGCGQKRITRHLVVQRPLAGFANASFASAQAPEVLDGAWGGLLVQLDHNAASGTDARILKQHRAFWRPLWVRLERFGQHLLGVRIHGADVAAQTELQNRDHASASTGYTEHRRAVRGSKLPEVWGAARRMMRGGQRAYTRKASGCGATGEALSNIIVQMSDPKWAHPRSRDSAKLFRGSVPHILCLKLFRITDVDEQERPRVRCLCHHSLRGAACAVALLADCPQAVQPLLRRRGGVQVPGHGAIARWLVILNQNRYAGRVRAGATCGMQRTGSGWANLAECSAQRASFVRTTHGRACFRRRSMLNWVLHA